ncbi:MAG: hypothetical protein D5R99_01605 [Methanocalculus sp. MSAO_Arc1]|uniref:hypothetical protein n=1 Tax=Methanocalculus TaxID=71151 RepID=UPI000FF3CA19|nr:hypothetical protein [Methanocalculus sp. AMF5]MCP1663100.1 hypothetical protein [Methanocalculus sp. AMF5]RQD81565.1 MAG: hypothetical protein D5R99_01605 [Methanocalculus sp. MSAO_Arc1]
MNLWQGAQNSGQSGRIRVDVLPVAGRQQECNRKVIEMQQECNGKISGTVRGKCVHMEGREEADAANIIRIKYSCDAVIKAQIAC